MDQRIERLIALFEGSSTRAEKLTSLLKQLNTAMEKATSVDAARAAAKNLQTGLAPLIEEEQKSASEGIDLAKQLGDAPPTTDDKPVRAEDIASHFRTLVETVQLDARRPRAGELATTLKSFDVEIKGLIVVDDKEARVVTPTAGVAIDPGRLSTIRMSFGSIPALTTREPASTEPIK
jgi:hypothetical protein